MQKNRIISVVVLIIVIALYWTFRLPEVGNVEIPTSPEAIARGSYLFNAGGCSSCHQVEGKEGLIGGYAIEAPSPLGGTITFYSANITTDKETGIGNWTGKDFILALKHGRSPTGGFYWPAFPYRSYRGMNDEDVLDIAAYMMSLPAIANAVPDHEKPAWLFDWLMAGWNIMADLLEGNPPGTSDDPQIQRGAYLARHFSHCGTCHTPRNIFGIEIRSREFEGSEIASADVSPAGLSRWTHIDLVYFFESGMTASFDFVGRDMAKVIEHTKLLTPEDREALAAFLIRDTAE